MLVLSILLSAVCSDSQSFRCDRSVSATINTAGENRLKINVALGDVVSLELPKDVELRGEPALGNASLFDVQVVAEPLRVLIWPRPPKNAANIDPESLIGVRSNLQLFLDSGITILLELRIARSKRSVQRVTFSFPEREAQAEYVRERLLEQGRRFEAEYREKEAALRREIGRVARERVAAGLMLHGECDDLRQREMHDLIVLRVHRLCRIGSDFFAVFSVHNRSRDAFTVETIEVRPSGDDGEPLDAILTYEGPQFLPFDRRVRGVVGWTVEEDGPVPSEWSLGARESGSRGRSVEMVGVGF